MKARVWIWIVVGVVLILFGYLFFQGSPAPSESYELSAPDTIAITQGTEGSINGLEIGVTFVDRTSAGVSVYDTNESANKTQQAVLEIGESIVVGGHELRLLDSLPNDNSAVFQVTTTD